LVAGFGGTSWICHRGWRFDRWTRCLRYNGRDYLRCDDLGRWSGRIRRRCACVRTHCHELQLKPFARHIDHITIM
jgi:hypothetical protein